MLLNLKVYSTNALGSREQTSSLKNGPSFSILGCMKKEMQQERHSAKCHHLQEVSSNFRQVHSYHFFSDSFPGMFRLLETHTLGLMGRTRKDRHCSVFHHSSACSSHNPCPKPAVLNLLLSLFSLIIQCGRTIK